MNLVIYFYLTESQNILNHKIVMRFPTMILILDFFFLIFCIVLFEITTGDTIDYLFTIGDENVHPPASTATVALMLMCGAYFLLREVVQIVSLVALGESFRSSFFSIDIYL